jgi:hypothetical protein
MANELTFEQVADLAHYFLGPEWEPVELPAQLYGNANRGVMRTHGPYPRLKATWDEVLLKAGIGEA